MCGPRPDAHPLLSPAFTEPTAFFRSRPHFCRGLNKIPTPTFPFRLRTCSFFENIRKPAGEILVQLLLQSRAQPSVEVDEVAVSWKRTRSISMQKEQNPSNSRCCRGFCIPGQAGCCSSAGSGKSEIKQEAWCACLHINTRSVFSPARDTWRNWCLRAAAIAEFPTLVRAASPYVCSARFLLLQTHYLSECCIFHPIFWVLLPDPFAYSSTKNV